MCFLLFFIQKTKQKKTEASLSLIYVKAGDTPKSKLLFLVRFLVLVCLVRSIGIVMYKNGK